MAKLLFKAAFTLTALAGSLLTPAVAQTLAATAQQRDAAQQVAQAGVPLGELKADAPASYTVKPGDTLWGIAALYLKAPWHWPLLWGMNLAEINNPHRIYPGQTLYLQSREGRALLQAGAQDATADMPTVRLSPRVRAEKLGQSALPTLKGQLIEPFLAEPMILEEAELNAAARIVAAQDSRVLLTRGDRAYARSLSGSDLIDDPAQKQKIYRVFRNATPLKDPLTGVVLGYEAQYVGKMRLLYSEGTQQSTGPDGQARSDIVPATLDVLQAKEEMRVGDRLLPEPAQPLLSYVPRAPQNPVDARIVSVYGSAVVNAAQNQVVAINKGQRDGIESGHVLAIMTDGARLIDKTDATLPEVKLPDERNGLLMVFRTFETLSYALVLEITQGVKVGDHLVNPGP